MVLQQMRLVKHKVTQQVFCPISRNLPRTTQRRRGGYAGQARTSRPIPLRSDLLDSTTEVVRNTACDTPACQPRPTRPARSLAPRARAGGSGAGWLLHGPHPTVHVDHVHIPPSTLYVPHPTLAAIRTATRNGQASSLLRPGSCRPQPSGGPVS